MKTRLVKLAAERELLIARSDEQRAALSRQVETWRRPAAVVDQGAAVVAYLDSHPQSVAVVTALIAALWPRRTVKWVSRGWFAWRLVRTLARLRASVG